MIYRIEALNYRSLHYVSQVVHPFQTLVGPNASGKSTFLDVVALLGDFVRYGVDETLLFSQGTGRGRARRFDELVFNQMSDHFELAVEFAVPSRLKQDQSKNDMSLELYHDIARYEVSFGKSASGEIEIRAETLWLIESSRNGYVHYNEGNRQLGLFPMEQKPPKTLLTTGKTPNGWKTVVKKVPGGNDYFKAENSNWNIMFRIGPRKAALSALPEDSERFPIAIWVRNLLLDGIRVLALNSAAMRRPVSPSASRGFSVEGANLPLVIQDLANKHLINYRDWVAHIQTILPELADIEVHERPEDRHLYLAISYASTKEPVPSWLVSDGTLRLLALTLLAYIPEQDGIYLIEEPENGIHPKAVELG